MTLAEIAQRIDKSKNNEDWIDFSVLGNDLDITVGHIEDQERLKSYWVGNWYCTDSSVGYRMYFLDDEPVAFSFQNGRKSCEDIRWFGRDKAIRVQQYLLSLMGDNLCLATCEMDEDIADSYKITFNEQLLSCNRPYYNGKPIKIIERIRNAPYGCDTELRIKTNDGAELVVDISCLDFKYYVD